MNGWRLVSDVGGSNVRFARSPGHHTLTARKSYTVRDYAEFYDALSAYLDETGGAAGCTGAAIGVAGPVDGDHVQLTNAPWSIATPRVTDLLGGAPAKLVNDLQAVALALPYLGDDELRCIGTVERGRKRRQTMIAVNVGTGFGGSTAIPAGDGWVTNPGEPGHMSFGIVNKAQLDLLDDARCVESLLSGRGVERLYGLMAQRAGKDVTVQLTGSEIFARAGSDDVAGATVRIFSELLGRVAGDLVLATAAWGGVYLCGSVVSGWAAAGGVDSFRTHFEHKGAMSDLMSSVYSGIIAHDETPLVGLTYLQV